MWSVLDVSVLDVSVLDVSVLDVFVLDVFVLDVFVLDVVTLMWSRFEREPRDACAVSLCRVGLLGKCRPGRRHQRTKGGSRPASPAE
jgi:hypothetical protein